MTKKKDNKEQETPQEEVCCEQAQAEKENFYDQLLRLQAEFENYRKRTEREKPMFIQYGRAGIIKKLLPLYDALLKAAAEIDKKETDAAHIKQGLKMIFEEFDKVFKSEGVQITSAIGRPYDPMTQEAITTMPAEDKDDGLVVDEIVKGVSLNGEILRPAQVIVGKKKEEAN